MGKVHSLNCFAEKTFRVLVTFLGFLAGLQNLFVISVTGNVLRVNRVSSEFDKHGGVFVGRRDSIRS